MKHDSVQAHLETSSEMSSPKRSAEVFHRPRTRSSVTIRHLPPEILTNIFIRLHIRDVLSVRKVCKDYNEIANQNTVWQHISFFKTWPSTDRLLQHFVKAAKHDNFEALVKLAFSRLYNERLPQNERQLSLQEHAEQAARYFWKAEELSSATFSWVFLRPPWAPNQPSCKVYVFHHLMEQAVLKKLKKSRSKIALCIGRTLQFREKEQEAASYIRYAAELGLHEAQVLQWELQYSKDMSARRTNSAQELAAVRELRSMVKQKPTVMTQLMLCKCYLKGMLGGYDWWQAVTFTRQVFQSSRPVSTCPVWISPSTQPCSERYILLDWLVEVANNLKMPTKLLLNTVAIVDRCLLAHKFGKAEIQLLGVTALLITSRCMSTDILTIREAVWFTDNTYVYENVVEMMGHIISVLKGNVRQVTSHDFVGALEPMLGLRSYEVYVLDYITELCMLQDFMTVYSPAVRAAALIVMVRILENMDDVWPSVLEEATGFTLRDLSPCVWNINASIAEEVKYDNQDIPLEAVKQRFTGGDLVYDLSHIKGLEKETLQEKLGEMAPIEPTTVGPKVYKVDQLILSPSRGKQRSRRMSMVERPRREDAATPPVEMDASGYEGDYDCDSDSLGMNESFRSEDTEEDPRTDSFLEMSSEPDRPPHFISDCSRAALHSPYGIKINISNISYSTSASSGLGSSSALASVCQSLACSSSGYSDMSHQECVDSEEDVRSLGFSCVEELSSQDEGDGSENMSEQKDSNPASLPYPTMESSSGGPSWGRRHDVMDFDYEQEDYGVLNEAFYESDIEQPSTSKSYPLLQSQYLNPADVGKSSQNTRKKHISEDLVNTESLEGEEARSISRPQTRGMSASCALSATNKPVSQCTEGYSQGFSVQQELCQPSCSVAEQNSAPVSRKQTVGREALETNRSSSVSAKSTESSTASNSTAKRRNSPITYGGEYLSSPVTLSIPSPQQPHTSVPDASSATARRKSLRSSARTLMQLQESAPLHSDCVDKKCECIDVHELGQKCLLFCESLCIPNVNDPEGKGEDVLSATTKRKSPRFPALGASPDCVLLKRQRRSSGHYFSS